MAPGLGGSVWNLYIMGLLYYARPRGYKIGVIRFRNTDGIPVTSNKLNYSGSYEDLKVVLEYVNDKYLKGESPQSKKRTRLYLYGCSSGAVNIGLYLANYSQ